MPWPSGRFTFSSATVQSSFAWASLEPMTNVRPLPASGEGVGEPLAPSDSLKAARAAVGAIAQEKR